MDCIKGLIYIYIYILNKSKDYKIVNKEFFVFYLKLILHEILRNIYIDHTILIKYLYKISK